MLLGDDQVESLRRKAEEALQNGRPAEAALHFEQLAAGSLASEGVWLLLAGSRAAAGDVAGEETALNRLLELRPESVLGHIRKADCRARARDDDFACFFYRGALRLAGRGELPQETAPELERAARVLAQIESRTHAKRQARLTERGLPPQQWSPRFRHSLEIAAGQRKLYLQQPTAFNYPGLPQIQFYEPDQFSWVPALEAAAGAIREELDKLLEKGVDEFRAYIHSEVNSAPLEANKALLNSKAWSVLPLCENGWLMPEVIRRCPQTWQAVLQTPVPRISGWGPTVLFSMLRGGAHIARHSGMFNTRLICHLPLIVPPGCRFRVGNEVREWQEGKLLIFDDTIEHEAWNDSREDRIVLIFDIWRPELTEREKRELTLLFSD